MLSNNLVVIPNLHKTDKVCDFVLQTTTQLSLNNQVYIIDTKRSYSIREILFNLIGKQKKLKLKNQINGIAHLTPIELIPFQRFKTIKKINQALYYYGLQIFLSLKHYQAPRKIWWMFFPHLVSITQYRLKSWKIIYDCVDYFQHLSTKMPLKERGLIAASDLMFVNSQALRKIHSTQNEKTIHFMPQGFRLKAFRSQQPKKLNGGSQQIVLGFVGAISRRLDLQLIKKIAINQPNWKIILWGPEVKFNQTEPASQQLEQLKQLTNISFGQSSAAEIPRIIKHFDIGLIPYDATIDFNRYSYPMKLFEYFYMGKPVVSTPIEELKRFPRFVKIGTDAQEWSRHIKKLLKKPWSDSYKQQQRQLAIANSWENKIEAIMKIIDGKI